MTRPPRRRAASLLAGLMALVLASVTACSGSGSESGGGGRNISISVVAGWDEDVAASNLWKSLLEERGYTVNMQELDIASTFTAVANGQVDLYMDAWLPTTHQAYRDRFTDQLEVVSTWQEGRNTVVVRSAAVTIPAGTSARGPNRDPTATRPSTGTAHNSA